MSALRTAIVLLAACLALAPAHAERADRDQPVRIEADRMTADDAKQVAVFEGRVVLTQGTFELRAERLTVRQDKEGNQYGIAVGKPATFRQKRDGAEEWIDGEAMRIEYSGRTERVELFECARVMRSQDEVRGEYISYDTRSEVYRVQGAKDQPDAAGKSRVTAVIQPKKKDDDGAPRAVPKAAAPCAEGAKQ